MPQMQRTQVYLEPEVIAGLDRLARDRRASRSELIRLAVRRLTLSCEKIPFSALWGWG
jgi:metal-responsive CopG/Arc/MetJ family transcriptional regulator